MLSGWDIESEFSDGEVDCISFVYDYLDGLVQVCGIHC